MKPLLFLIGFLIIIAGCGDPKSDDPYVSPAFPPATFHFSVYPQDSVLHVGDTITFSAAISNKFGNTTLTDGQVYLGLFIGGSNHIPQIDEYDIFECHNGEHYNMINYFGHPFFGTGPPPGLLLADTTSLQNDSFKIEFSFVMLKKGLYQFNAESGSLTSSKGKTGVNGVFDVVNHHWSFFQVPGLDTPLNGTSDYNRIYLFGVE